MSKAACSSTKLTRRAAIAASLAGITAPALAARALSAPDPALAAIAAHKAAYAAFDRACRVTSDLERQIPAERRKEWFREDREAGIGTHDDPRWTAAKAAYWDASEAEEGAAWALAHVQPAGLAGAAALLRYAHDYEAGGCDWPCDPEGDAGDGDWHGTFHVSLAAALDGLACAGSG